mmetsp:Transcript_1277/g.3654  ORF Transcript_1277/g.3654 Transcript_1277/m.3654 type:complete len:979 (+) Transcript_1277:114-3050(+)
MSQSSQPPRATLPQRGVARVKNVLSGDTVVLLGKAAPGQPAPEVVFTFERVTAPRMASKANSNRDDPGAFPAREWLRKMCVGKNVSFETRKQGAAAGDRVYGVLLLPDPSGVSGRQLNLAVEAVRNGHATPKVFGRQSSRAQGQSGHGGQGGGDGNADGSADATSSSGAPAASSTDDADGAAAATGGYEDPVQLYERQLQDAFQGAKSARAGVHSSRPLVRTIKNAGDDFKTQQLVSKVQQRSPNGRVRCVIEYIFDGSRFRCQVTGPTPEMEEAGILYGSFTLILAGVASPRMGNPRASPPTEDEAFAVDARDFVSTRLLHRELEMTIHGTDKAGVCAVGTVHHPRGNIAAELLKAGLARVSDWSARMMDPKDVPAFRMAENNAKRANFGVWHSYEAPQISGASEISGVVVEALTGDTVNILPDGVAYEDESRLKKVSLASVRAPRAGNERYGKPDDPYANECRDRLRQLTVGKEVNVTIHYEREIPMGKVSENRQFGTFSVGKRPDVGEVLISEGLAVTQRHRDDEEKSPRYDDLIAAESIAVAAKKGVHNADEYKKSAVNDLTNPQKAKAYSDTLIRAGVIKAVVEYCFNGSRFKLLLPSENCSIVFALSCLRAPQASPMPGAKIQTKPEPFGDECKRHSRQTILQRNVEIRCTGVTLGGVVTGELWVGQGGQRRSFSVELVTAGLCSVDQRKIDYGEAPQEVIDAQKVAQANKAGVWSIEREEIIGAASSQSTAKAVEQIKTVQLSEIRSGNHFFYTIIGDEGSGLVEESMKLFTANNGTTGASCDVKKNKVVAALFDGSWYRAKILEKKGTKASVLYIDHGNVDTVPIATHLRPLDDSLGTDKIPAVAKEAYLALTEVRSIDDDDGHDAAKMLQSIAWGKPVNARIFCDIDGKAQVALMDPTTSSSINEQLIAAGLARKAKQFKVHSIENRMVDGSIIASFAAGLSVSQDAARRSRTGMWRYGDVGEDDEEER